MTTQRPNRHDFSQGIPSVLPAPATLRRAPNHDPAGSVPTGSLLIPQSEIDLLCIRLCQISDRFPEARDAILEAIRPLTDRNDHLPNHSS